MDTGRQPGDDAEPEIVRAWRQYFEHENDPEVVAARETIKEVAQRYREHRQTKEDFAAARAANLTLRARLPAYFRFRDAASDEGARTLSKGCAAFKAGITTLREAGMSRAAIEQIFQHYLDLEWLGLDLPAISADEFVVGSRERNSGRIDKRIRDRYKTAKSARLATMSAAYRRADEDGVLAAIVRHIDMLGGTLHSIMDKIMLAWLRAATEVRNESLPLDVSRDRTTGDLPR